MGGSGAPPLGRGPSSWKSSGSTGRKIIPRENGRLTESSIILLSCEHIFLFFFFTYDLSWDINCVSIFTSLSILSTIFHSLFVLCYPPGKYQIKKVFSFSTSQGLLVSLTSVLRNDQESGLSPRVLLLRRHKKVLLTSPNRSISHQHIIPINWYVKVDFRLRLYHFTWLCPDSGLFLSVYYVMCS